MDGNPRVKTATDCVEIAQGELRKEIPAGNALGGKPDVRKGKTAQSHAESEAITVASPSPHMPMSS